MTFTAPVYAVLRTAQLNENAIKAAYDYYKDFYTTVPGAPDLQSLTADDAEAALHLPIFKTEVHTDWSGLKAYVEAKRQKDIDGINPFLPNWYSKTDDRPGIWVSDTTDWSPEAKVSFHTIIRDSSPALTDSIEELLCVTPTGDMDYLQDVMVAMGRTAPLFAWELGEGDNENFRWSVALCLVGGMSVAALRVFAASMQHEEAWQHWYKATDEEIVKDLLDARKICGYPLGLLRCDFKQISNLVGNLTMVAPNGNLVTPRWYKSIVALHLYKYVRYYGGPSPAFFCAYNGQYNRMKIDPAALHMSLGAPENAGVAKLICKTLGLPYNATRNNRTWEEDVVAEVLQKMQPLYFPESRDATAYPDMLVGPAVKFAMYKERKSALGWVRPQIAVTGVARLDYEAGKVITNAVITDAEVFNIRWPEATASLGDIATWQLSIPTDVRPVRFSTIVSERLRNWNKMGHPEGACAVLDAMVTLDLFRENLSGSLIGTAIRREYPLVFILPTGSTTDDTTNQGKTSMACLIGDALVPGLSDNVVTATASTSPPAMRTLAEPIYRYGSAIYDEFLVPSSPEHILNQRCLQSLATGGTIAPGRALENDLGVSLKHPVFFSAKVVKNVKDIQNRMLPIFLDALTPETRCTDDELAEIAGGRASIVARWCHLLWCHNRRILQKLLPITPRGGPEWRFQGHLTASSFFASPAQVGAYMECCADYCTQQISRAEESGLAENIGLNTGFDPKFFFQQMHEETADRLAMMAKEGHLEILDALSEIVEDGGRRKFGVALKGCSEASAKHRFIDMFKRADKHQLTTHNTTLAWVSSKESQWKPSGDAKAHIVVTQKKPKPAQE